MLCILIFIIGIPSYEILTTEQLLLRCWEVVYHYLSILILFFPRIWGLFPITSSEDSCHILLRCPEWFCALFPIQRFSITMQFKGWKAWGDKNLSSSVNKGQKFFPQQTCPYALCRPTWQSHSLIFFVFVCKPFVSTKN